MAQITIRSEDDAYAALRALIQDRLEKIDGIVFEGWPSLKIRLRGDKFHDSITPQVMADFIDLQRSIYRGYALARYNTPDTRSLTAEERSNLELVIRVGDGSSIFDGENVIEIVNNLIKAAGEKMDAKHWVALALIFSLAYFGSSSYESYLDQQKEIKLQELKNQEQKQIIEGMAAASGIARERAALLKDAAKDHPQAENILRYAPEVQDAKTRIAKRGDDAEINGIRLDGGEAELLVSNARRSSIEIRLDGVYRITKLDNSDPLTYRVWLWNPATGKTIVATVQNETVAGESRAQIHRAVVDRQPIELHVNAKELKGEVKDAKIVKVVGLVLQAHANS